MISHSLLNREEGKDCFLWEPEFYYLPQYGRCQVSDRKDEDGRTNGFSKETFFNDAAIMTPASKIQLVDL
jgi:hypothetical protein